MGNVFTLARKYFVFAFVIVLFMALNQGVAHADTVDFHGITLGAYNSPPFSSNPTLFGLTHNGTSFPNRVATLDTSIPNLTLAGTNVNLGSFTLSGVPANYAGNSFFLQLSFTFLPPPFPVTITGLTQPSFTAALTGSVQDAANGSVQVDFDNSPSSFSVFMNGNLVGTFRITVGDLTIRPGETVNVVGTANLVGASQVPEPATLFMLGAGWVGLGTAVRKRRNRGTMD